MGRFHACLPADIRRDAVRRALALTALTLVAAGLYGAAAAAQGGDERLAGTRTTLEQWVQGARRPDLTILLDVSVDTGLTRAGRRSAPDRFERQEGGFFERVRRGYLSLAEAEPTRFRVIDASQPLESVSADIRSTILTYVSQESA